MSFVGNTFYLLNFSKKIYLASHKNRSLQKYVTASTLDVTAKARAMSDDTISENLFAKFRWYMTNTLFFGQMLTDLTGVKRTTKEDKAYMYIGVIGAFTDLLIDDYKVDEEKMRTILSDVFLESKSRNITGLLIEDMFRLYLNSFYEHFDISNVEEFKRCLVGVMTAQINSAKQFDQNILEKDIIDITSEKGGYSLELCCSIYPELKGDVTTAMYKIGVLLQFLNDAQDIHKDLKSGIKTFAHFKNNFTDISDTLICHRDEAFRAVMALDLPFKNKEKFLFGFNTIVSGVLYKIDCYSKTMNNDLDFNKMAQLSKSDFNIPVFNMHSFRFNVPRTMGFDAKKYELV